MVYKTCPMLFILIAFLSVNSTAGDTETKRTSFSLPLVKIIALKNTKSTEFRDVRISINGKKEYAIITPDDDYQITIILHGKEQVIYAEQPNARYMLNEFESGQMDRVITGFTKTLSLLDQFIEKGKWDRCRYLDSFLPRFLKSFYYFSCTALNMTNALPPETNFPDTLFDISLNSTKTDTRVRYWKHHEESQIKLRIATRELIFHLTDWQSKELNIFEPNTHIEFSPEVKEAYRLFIKLYFTL